MKRLSCHVAPPGESPSQRLSRRILFVLGGCAALLHAACDNAGTAAVQAVLPPENADPARWVLLDGANNTRDIGGYATADGRQVRWKTVYRSGELPDLTDAGCTAFQELGVRRLIDFRNRLTTSSLFGGDAPCVIQTTPASLLRVTLNNDDPALANYVEGVLDNSSSYRRAFELLADPVGLPLLYHCAAGKDRTGIMTALLLALLGVDRETVIADYELSNLVGAEVEAQAIIDLLDEVDRQGGIEAYLSGIGVSPETQAAIRTNLLE